MAVATRSMPAPATEWGTGARGKRRRQILDVAAARFRSHGYGAASIYGAIPAEVFSGPHFARIFAIISLFGNFGVFLLYDLF